ncbi:MAG: D-alanyl-D-alanine carboxypeptidase family protein [Acidobacteriota bacterium]|nr:D-alanyl-D-alanine carboxypeptidase family protein [Acidobacteriota bacterium]
MWAVNTIGERDGRRDGERGDAMLSFMLSLAFALFVIMLALFVTLMTVAPTPPAPATEAMLPGAEVDAERSNGGGRLPDEAQIEDLGTGGLVCVRLPGVSYPKTPALDRRVARRWLAVKQDLDAQGIAITMTWGFRTNCQQRNINPGGNLKAVPGTSPHEAGRAVDVNGIGVRGDAGRIIAAFRRQNWVWLGRRDPPHFEVKGHVVGEPNHIVWIRKSQAAYNSGAPVEGCRGTPCGR